LDLLYGVSKAISFGLLNLGTFDLTAYEHYEMVQNGDWNWIADGFLAFASPNDRDYVNELKNNGGKELEAKGNGKGKRGRTVPKSIQKTIEYFKSNQVKLVVRLNNPLYDKRCFEDEGIRHLVRLEREEEKMKVVASASSSNVIDHAFFQFFPFSGHVFR